MLNIFNLFLFLLALWITFMVVAGNISWLYLGFGIVSAAFVAFSSSKLKLVEEKSELLYLSFGFYRHFFKIYCGSFFSSLNLIVEMAFRREPFKPVIHVVKITNKNRINLALFATSINMNTGLFCIGMRDNEAFIHAVEEQYFAKFNVRKLLNILPHINDDNLV